MQDMYCVRWFQYCVTGGHKCGYQAFNKTYDDALTVAVEKTRQYSRYGIYHRVVHMNEYYLSKQYKGVGNTCPNKEL